ncbi:MAG: FkbM family methyltransferase [Gammaproteobacteria bacterium]|nr:FkbM family methyltransferase [Gammaproteobacteria bacterium]
MSTLFLNHILKVCVNNNSLEKITSYLDGEKITLFDIGARYGIHPRWGGIASILRVYAFEPDPKECARINASAQSLPYQLECLPYALGDDTQNAVPLYVCKDPGCSSLYQPNMELVRQFHFGESMEVESTLQVSINRLQDVCEQYKLRPDVIKIDTQGYELNILKGAGASLEDVKLVELEVEFNEQYQGQPLFSDIDLYMRSRGFALLGLRRTYWRRKVSQESLKTPFGGQIMHGDAIYYNEKLLNDRRRILSSADLIRLCILLSIYQQDDFVAYLLTQSHPAVRAIPEPERIALAVALQNHTSRMNSFIGRLLDLVRKRFWLPHTSLRGMVDNLQSKHAKDWHDPDFH